MEFLLLGGVEARTATGPVELGPARQQTVLASLLVDVNRPVTVEQLVQRVWGHKPPQCATQTLYGYVSRLRRLLPGVIARGSGGGYVLTADEQNVDLHRFRRLLVLARRAEEDAQALALFDEAAALWREEPFASADTPWFNTARNTLRKERWAAELDRNDLRLRFGEHAALLPALAEHCAAHPMDERLAAQYMLALYRCGRQADALAHYRHVRGILSEELGVDAGRDLQQLHEAILAGDTELSPAMRPGPAPALVSAAAPAPAPVSPGMGAAADRAGAIPSHLPLDVRGFVGRNAELDELDGLLSAGSTAVIAIVVGTAGVGKTALAVRWAHLMRDRFPDGQLYVDLRGYGPDAPVSAADALAGFLRALGLDGAAIPEDLAERAARFRSLVSGRRMLVLLDNARTVDQVRPMLPAGVSCFTLVTSRDSLAGLVAREGAHRIGLDRLPQADAAGLLRTLLGAYADTEQAAIDSLAERCARLPLVLRIAAELVRSRPARTVADLAEELAEQAALDLLDVEGDPQTAVRAVFSWSYQQLSPPVARTFRLLGVHPGHDTDAYAVAAMTGTGLRDTRKALDVLVRAHLVEQTPGGRYQLHDLLRVYATELAETAGDGKGPLNRLFAYYLATASAAMDAIAPHEAERRPEAPAADAETPAFGDYHAAFGWLDSERAHLLAATQHAEPDYVIRMSDTVWRYLNIGGFHDDAMVLHTRALHAAEALGDIKAEANARRVLGAAALRTGALSPAIDHLERALALYRQVGDRSLQAATLNNLGVGNWRQSNLSAAADCFRQALTLYEEYSVHQRLRAPATNNLARILHILGRSDEALELFEQALAIARENGNQASESNTLCGLADVNAAAGRHREALDYAHRALVTARNAGHRSLEGTAMRTLGVVHRRQGDHESALRHLDTALQISRDVGDLEEVMATLSALAEAHDAAGDPIEALRLHEEALTVDVGSAQRDLRAHALAGIGDLHSALGDREASREFWHQALVIYRELGMPQADDVEARVNGRHSPSAASAV
ncbi:AfsR/SARP family transcriptional regulator [Streptomyces indicus]|uniref:DNA-binding transcriptional activator of the SARP family n=1 Tax=Streptomyces indicus TaxID=417292 RepID=A0A1G8TL46_9ACTN|nr:tetratricopeptide repeat protein [Streptomyces indicus]SDJ42114.1 DNA-binding transcriptional activator of the SARP family [Streptomyces indicus]